jgi:hypothetical protein
MFSQNTGPLRTLLVTYHNTFNPSVCKVKFILFKKSILYCSTFLAPLQVWHIFNVVVLLTFFIVVWSAANLRFVFLFLVPLL